MVLLKMPPVMVAVKLVLPRSPSLLLAWLMAEPVRASVALVLCQTWALPSASRAMRLSNMPPLIVDWTKAEALLPESSSAAAPDEPLVAEEAYPL